jgi:poly(3-hydroxybutyrate) depolymerase
MSRCPWSAVATAAAIVVTSACGCSRKAGSTIAGSSGDADDPAATGVGGEDGAPDASHPRTGTFHLRTKDGKGKSRDYEVIVPASYDPAVPLAVTFVYHGFASNEAGAIAFGLQRAPGAANASIFVFPQGIPFQEYGVGWDNYCTGYDMVFFDNMLGYLKTRYHINDAEVFAAGFSWGCAYLMGLICCRGDEIRAIAGASCGDDFADKTNYKTYINLPCPSAGGTAIRFTHDADRDVAYTARDFVTTSEFFRNFNSCSSASVAAGGGSCVSYQDCSKPLIECSYRGLGHALPQNWAVDTWNFLSSFK